MKGYSKNDIDVALVILKYAIVAIPFWLTAVRYSIDHFIEDGDDHFDIVTVFFGGLSLSGLLALLIAVTQSTDIISTAVSPKMRDILDLIDLFAILAFGLLATTIANQMVEEDAKLGLYYTFSFIILAGFIVFAYSYGPTIIVFGVLLIVVALYMVWKVVKLRFAKKVQGNRGQSLYVETAADLAVQIFSLVGVSGQISHENKEQIINITSDYIDEKDIRDVLDEVESHQRNKSIQDGFVWLFDRENH